ncbi:MAG: NAD-binding protein [Halanaerobiaceae bacterium]
MYIVIAGAGVLGRALTKRLIENHNVVIIDIEQEVCERIYSQYGAVSVCGNATQIHVLKDAGIEKCDVAIAAMDSDTENLAFTVLAKNFGVDKIMVRMRNPEYKSAYKMAGATNIGEVTDMLVENYTTHIENPDIRRVVSLGNGNAEISIVTIPEGSKCSGKTVSEIVNTEGFPDDCVIAGIYNQELDKLIIPRGEKKLHSKNQIFLVATRENIRRAADFFVD